MAIDTCRVDPWGLRARELQPGQSDSCLRSFTRKTATTLRSCARRAGIKRLRPTANTVRQQEVRSDRPGSDSCPPAHNRLLPNFEASTVFADYRAAAAEREALGVPALPLNAAQTGALVELLAAPAAAFPRCGGPTWAAWRRMNCLEPWQGPSLGAKAGLVGPEDSSYRTG